MPNTVRISRGVKYLEIALYILLLCFVIPIKIDNKGKESTLEKQYGLYLKRFNKSYKDEMYHRKLEAFKKSLENIEELNYNRTASTSAKYGLTKYSDMLSEEFLNSHLISNFSSYLQGSSNYVPSTNTFIRMTKRSVLSVPGKVDWREKNVVTRVENQRSCGACWAFATVAIAESQYAIKTEKLEKFSVQEMIDCSENNDGCSGGDVHSLLKWIKNENVTIVKEEEYPLTLTDEQCKQVSANGIRIKNFICKNFIGIEYYLLDWIAKYGPIAVAINALSWQNYVNGIIQFHCDSSTLSLNHAVQIVGYDLTAEIPHYIVRNSWGEDFGDNGYLYIAMGNNLCGLAREVCIVDIL